ncbi:MAG TPA: adenylate/guanylate cyclase domain-containing protein [Saprospiraceae bacterium]|nr:adenylate/guanylate cyclase domain-containing protein [Saprospiraceae bacterium]
MKNLRSWLLCLLPLFAFPSAHIWAQTEQLKELENEMLASSGSARAEQLIALADACIAAGYYGKAEDWAEEAEGFAKRLRMPELRAIAFNRYGRAQALNGKRKAAGKFESSLEILRDIGSPNRALMLDNLENLRRLALRNKHDKELAQIEIQIAKLKGTVLTPALPPRSSATPPPPSVSTPLTRQELRDELSSAIHKLAQHNQANAEAQRKWEAESERLQAELASKQAALDTMNEREMKANMILMQQRFLLDSLSFKAEFDSLSISNSNLALREAKSTRNAYLAGIIALMLLSGGMLYSSFRAREYTKALEGKNTIIREEQKRSEDLLLNILPALVADELKKQGHTRARYFEDVSVLFADFVGFSNIAERLTPQQLVSELDACFQQFDAIVVKHNLEKIKTIGDAYMCAGGVLTQDPREGSQLRGMVQAAREMQAWLLQWNLERERLGLPRYDARIGIHAGPVVAGVVGSKKFAFDIWGDTVNIAARVEQAGEGGKINVSGKVYEAIKGEFDFKHRGRIPVKNKGEIEMYFLEN